MEKGYLLHRWTGTRRVSVPLGFCFYLWSLRILILLSNKPASNILLYVFNLCLDGGVKLCPGASTHGRSHLGSVVVVALNERFACQLKIFACNLRLHHSQRMCVTLLTRLF
jgi:hypothetical protein